MCAKVCGGFFLFSLDLELFAKTKKAWFLVFYIFISLVVGARQSFQIFRQNTRFLENNRALPRFWYGILHYLINTIKL